MLRAQDQYRWGALALGVTLYVLSSGVSSLAADLRSAELLPESAARCQQDRDLAVIRELNERVRHGEISEQERALLWQAYLARLAAVPRTDAEGAKKARFPVFTGPGL